MPLQMKGPHDERVKQIAIGVSILIMLTVGVAGLVTGWRLLPGLLGEWIGTMIGILTTPFFMEASFIVLGLVIVIGLNLWRQHKDGDEFVYLEQVAGPNVPMNLPDHAKWAVYRQKPLTGEVMSGLALAEGAFAIGDFPAAVEYIGTLNHAELKQPDTLRLRLALAEATGRDALAAQLRAEINASESPQA